jgi:hypothetical protein
MRAATLLMLMLASAVHAEQVEAGGPKPFKANYVIYSGDLGEQLAPTRNDRKMSIQVTGQSARDIFDSIGPDIKAECSTEKGDRERRKGSIWCFYLPSDGYTCYFGFDLRTGKSIDGGEC